MIDVISIVQVKAYARQAGLILALLWIASFAFMVLAPNSSVGSLLAMATPFFVGWLLKCFRHEALSGLLSFRRGLAFSCLTFFYASLVFALVQFLYFRFLDGGTFLSNIASQIDMLDKVYVEKGMPPTNLKDGVSLMLQLTPIQMAFTFMMQNVFIGGLLSLPIAFVCKKKQR